MTKCKRYVIAFVISLYAAKTCLKRMSLNQTKIAYDTGVVQNVPFTAHKFVSGHSTKLFGYSYYLGGNKAFCHEKSYTPSQYIIHIF